MSTLILIRTQLVSVKLTPRIHTPPSVFLTTLALAPHLLPQVGSRPIGQIQPSATTSFSSVLVRSIFYTKPSLSPSLPSVRPSTFFLRQAPDPLGISYYLLQFPSVLVRLRSEASTINFPVFERSLKTNHFVSHILAGIVSETVYDSCCYIVGCDVSYLYRRDLLLLQFSYITNTFQKSNK